MRELRVPFGVSVNVILSLVVALPFHCTHHDAKSSSDTWIVPVQSLLLVLAVIVDGSIASLNVTEIVVVLLIPVDEAESAGSVLTTVGAVVSPGGVTGSSSPLSSHPVKRAILRNIAQNTLKNEVENGFLFMKFSPLF
jgi:hypothetical protein